LNKVSFAKSKVEDMTAAAAFIAGLVVAGITFDIEDSELWIRVKITGGF